MQTATLTMKFRERIHPDTALNILGYVSRPGEGTHAAENRRRRLTELHDAGLLSRTPNAQGNGWLYYRDEVEELARRQEAGEKLIQRKPFKKAS